MTIAVLRHPLQQAACAAIEQLITDLRQIRTNQDYFEFQRVLFQHVHDAEILQWEAKRNLELEKKGKRVSAAPVTTWELELVVLDRVVRQLKTVGDALAWRRFGFRRPPIIALSRDDGGGPMVHKEGLPYELGQVVDIWNTHKRFALLNGLTNCIRVADVTEFADDHIVLHEVKKNQSKTDPKQQQRMREIAHSVNAGVPLRTAAGFLQLWAVRTQLRSRVVPDLRDAITIAEREGVAVAGLGYGWVVHCASAGGWPAGAGSQADVAADMEMRAKALVEKHVAGATHRFQALSIDQGGRALYYAPFSIYPLSPEKCAKLTCDYLIFQSVISANRIQTAFEIAGFTNVECLAPDASDVSDGNQQVFRMIYGNRLIHMRGTTIGQMLLEMIDPKLHAQAWKESFSFPAEQDVDQSISFANERAVWR